MIRRTSLALLAAALLGGLGTGTALAASSVVQAIRAQDKIIQANPEYKQLGHLKIRTAAQAKAAIPKFAALKGSLDQAATAVSQATATTAKQKAGQKDWVTGVREVATGVGGISSGLKQLVAGQRSKAQTTLLKAVKTIAAGNLLGLKADKLLGLPSGD